MNRLLFNLLSGICFLGLSVSCSAQDVTLHRTPGGVEYGIWGTPDEKPAPTLMIFSGTIENTLSKPYFRQCGNALSDKGYLCVSIDLPCHGKEAIKGEPSGIAGWNHRIVKGENIVEEFQKRASEVLDHLIEAKITNPNRIAAAGTSRGGFLAIQFAAHDERVSCAAGFAPVTNLAALREFAGNEKLPLVKSLSLEAQAKRLAGKPVWLIIGDRDERVSTKSAMDFALALSSEAVAKDVPSQLELHVVSEPRGHTTPKGAAEQAAIWVHQKLTEKKLEKASMNQPGSNPDAQSTEQTLLLVDDYHVLYRSGTKRTFHPAILNPTNPVIREEKHWEMAIGWTSVLRHPETGKYQLWYQAYSGHRDERKTHQCVVCLAESDDGITFTKPSFGLHDFDATRLGQKERLKETNIVLIGNGGYGDRYANSVQFDPDESDAQKRYKMLYTDFSKDNTGQEWPGFHAAFSPDGIRWAKAKENPLNKTAYGGRGTQPPFQDENVYSEVWDKRKNFLRKTWRIPFSMSDAADVFFDPNRNAYVVYGKAWIQGPAGGLAWKHAMARTQSPDFLNWSKPELVSVPDEFDAPNTEFHTSPVFFYKGCYFSLNQILSSRGEASGTKADAMHIELMLSRDGDRWERPFRETPFIDNSQQAFSNGGIFTNATPVILDDENRFYYGGYNSGTIGGGAKLTDPSQQSGVGFASIPLDRFSGIRPVPLSAQSTLKRPLNNVGQVTLKPMSLSEVQSIELNCDASQGTVRVEVLDEDGYRVKGFSKDDAVAINQDSFRKPVKWKKTRISELPNGKYLLRIHLENAEIFSLSLKR